MTKRKKKLTPGKVVRMAYSKGMPRCKGCGFRIRGKQHESGLHHQATRTTSSKAGKRWHTELSGSGRIITSVTSHNRRYRG